ncbi:MAG TPA: ornithine racemase Orr [Anaerovoracaceae bacterium]|nr:ornithine racemase Orr [Anaerovoracaceae bacterium]
MYPRLVFDLKKVRENLDTIVGIVKSVNCSLMIVTKSFTADKTIVDLINQHPMVDYLADSRIDNIRKYPVSQKKSVLLRLPQQNEIEEVVSYADISLNSEIKTIELLNEEARRQRKSHKILIMIDLGDLREGMFYQEKDLIDDLIKRILTLSNIEPVGIGANLTCYGAIIPKEDNLSILVSIADEIRKKFKIEIPIVSGGNSSSLYLIEKGGLPKGINNLRIGEAFILGNETAYGRCIAGAHKDAVTLEAQIIEIKTKPSLPIGETGVDAFGEKPIYEDRGYIKRAILAIGKQDTDIESMMPEDPNIDILGASSDHLIMDVTNSKNDYEVGDIISFTLGYGGLLKASTSSFVKRDYKYENG